MSQKAVIRHLGKYHFELVEPLHYEVANNLVPKGFKTDLASVPRFLWSVIPPYGNYLEAAIIHDHALSVLPREKADHIFKMRMKLDRVKPWRVSVLYRAVRIFANLKKIQRHTR